MNILSVKNLDKYYKSKKGPIEVIKNCSFEVEENEFVAIMGPSGSGKTSLLNIISTIDRPTSGKIIIDGINISNGSEKELTKFRGDKLGFIFQDFNLINNLSLRENIAFAINIKGDNNYNEIDQLGKSLGILDILDKYPIEVSGGEKQRCSCARAIITNPSLILADEPTGNLDSHSSKQVLSNLRKLKEEKNATILMVTHDVFASAWTDRVLFLKDGKIWNEIKKKDLGEQAFFNKILEVMKVLGGNF